MNPRCVRFNHALAHLVPIQEHVALAIFEYLATEQEALLTYKPIDNPNPTSLHDEPNPDKESDVPLRAATSDEPGRPVSHQRPSDDLIAHHLQRWIDRVEFDGTLTNFAWNDEARGLFTFFKLTVRK